MTDIEVETRNRAQVPRVRLKSGLLQPRLVSRAPGFVHVALVAGGATLLGGDSVTIRVRVGVGCTLRIEDVGGTVAYPSTGSRSRWHVDVEIADGATLSWESYPFVITDSADVERRTTVVLGHDAVVNLRETLVLGRSNEVGGRISNETQIRDAAGEPYFIERLDLDGMHPQPGISGSAKVLDTALLAGMRAEDTEPLRREQDVKKLVRNEAGASAAEGSAASTAGSVPVRILTLERPGALARTLGTAAHNTHVDSVWKRWMTWALGRRARG